MIHNPRLSLFGGDEEEVSDVDETNLIYDDFIKYTILNKISLGQAPYYLGLKSDPGPHITAIEKALKKGELVNAARFKMDGKYSIETIIGITYFNKKLNPKSEKTLIDSSSLVNLDRYMVMYEKGMSQKEIIDELLGTTPTKEEKIIAQFNNIYKNNNTIQNNKSKIDNNKQAFTKDKLNYIIDFDNLISSTDKNKINRKLAWLEYKTNIRFYVLTVEMDLVLHNKEEKEVFIETYWKNSELSKYNKAILLVLPVNIAHSKPILNIDYNLAYPIIKKNNGITVSLKQTGKKTLTDLVLSIYKVLPKPYQEYQYHFFNDGTIMEEISQEITKTDEDKMIKFIFTTNPTPEREDFYLGYMDEKYESIYWRNYSDIKEEYVKKYGKAYVYKKSLDLKKQGGYYVKYQNIIPSQGNVPNEAIITDGNEKTDVYNKKLHDELIKENLEKIGVLSDVLFTVSSAGGYVIGKITLKTGAKFVIGMTVDVVLQVGIESLGGESFEDAVNKVDVGLVVYSGVESLLPGWRTQAGLGCLREATVGSIKKGRLDIKSVVFTCFENYFFNIISHGLIKKGSTISNKLEKVLEKSPNNVVKNLKIMGFDRDMLEWIMAHTGIDITEAIKNNYGE